MMQMGSRTLILAGSSFVYAKVIIMTKLYFDKKINKLYFDCILPTPESWEFKLECFAKQSTMRAIGRPTCPTKPIQCADTNVLY